MRSLSRGPVASVFLPVELAVFGFGGAVFAGSLGGRGVTGVVGLATP